MAENRERKSDLFDDEAIRSRAGVLLGIPGYKATDEVIPDARIKMAQAFDVEVSDSVQQSAENAVQRLIKASGLDRGEVKRLYAELSEAFDDRREDSLYFNRSLLLTSIDAMSQCITDTPSADELLSSENKSEMASEIRKISFQLFSIYRNISRLETNEPFINEYIASLSHDLGGLIMDYAGVADMYAHKGDSKYEEVLRFSYKVLCFARDILLANKYIIEDEFPMRRFNLSEVISRCTSEAAMRFSAKYYENGEEAAGENLFKNGAGGNVHMNVDTGLELRGNPELTSLLIFNLIKNPFRMAQIEKKSIDMTVSVEKATDDVISIFVVDTGKGISYDESRDHFTNIALRKREEGVPLNLCEELLINSFWRDKVTPYYLSLQLLRRGESMVKSGTGIGLDLVKKVVDAHQGDIRIYDHPELGAGVQILIPDMSSDNPDERRRATEKAIEQQIADNTPGARQIAS